MRATIVTPPQARATGNHVTAERHARGLRFLGWEVRVIEAPFDGQHLDRETSQFQPDVFLLLHAWRSGGPWLRSPRASEVPAAVLLTGTDIHGGLDSPEQGSVIRDVLQHAAATITQNPLTFETLLASPWKKRLHFLPPAVALGVEPYPLRLLHGITPKDVLLLHPAGIRPVKGNRELLFFFDSLARTRADFRVAFCGPILDPDYGNLFLEELAKRSWALYLGVLPPEAMAAALTETDVVLNNSASEGMSNALLEASALGRPILARTNAGNLAVVDDGENGLLYTTAEEFEKSASMLMNDGLRRRLALPRPERYTPEGEARVLDTLLRSIIPR